MSPLEGLVMAQQADRSLVFGLHFETSDQAARNLQAAGRPRLRRRPGQGGSFADRFESPPARRTARTS